jgi:tight adherence protein B
MLLFVLLLVLCFAIVFFVLRPTKTETAVRQQLENIQENRAEESGRTILREEGYGKNPETAEIVRQLPGALETLHLVQQAGQDWTVISVMGGALVAALASAWIASLFLPNILLAVVIGIAAGSSPYIYLLIRREQRFRKCDELLPEAIDLMSRGLRAGHALTAVLEMVANEIAEPISSEFRRLHEENALGLPLRDATVNLVTRLPRDDVRFLATAMLLQKETGGNLAAILDKTGVVARERARLRGQLRIYTAQGRVTGWVLCLMPFIMFGLLSTVNWQLEKMLFTEPNGRLLIYYALGSMLLGILFIRKVIDVKV